MAPWIRVASYLLAVQLVVAAAAVHHALAESHDALSAVGEGALTWAPRADEAHRETIVVNGLTLEVESIADRRSVAAVLGDATAACRVASEPMWRKLWHDTTRGWTLPHLLPAIALPAAMVGQRNDERGFVACVQPRPRVVPEALPQWTHRFIADGELTLPGVLRVTAARRTQTGSAVISLRSRGAVRPATLLRHDGDVPHPPLNIPRPPGARLSLHAADQDGGAQLVSFTLGRDGSQPKAVEALERYGHELRARGFSTGDTTRGARGGLALSATDRTGVTHLVTVDADGRQLVVTR